MLRFRFRHPLTVSDMSSFAAPESYGSYGYGLFSGAGTPERYSDIPNRYAYRTKTYYDEAEPEAEELKVLEDPVDVEGERFERPTQTLETAGPETFPQRQCLV